jgi:hypothetical protein
MRQEEVAMLKKMAGLAVSILVIVHICQNPSLLGLGIQPLFKYLEFAKAEISVAIGTVVWMLGGAVLMITHSWKKMFYCFLVGCPFILAPAELGVLYCGPGSGVSCDQEFSRFFRGQEPNNSSVVKPFSKIGSDLLDRAAEKVGRR